MGPALGMSSVALSSAEGRKVEDTSLGSLAGLSEVVTLRGR